MDKQLKLTPPANAPIAEKKPVQCEAHGVKWTDDYAWLRADNWQEAMREPDVLPAPIKAYLEAENSYCKEAMAGTEALQKELVAEMRGRMQEKDDSLPDLYGPYAYSYRYLEGAEHPVYLRTPREGGAEQVLIDVNVEAAKFEYFDHGSNDYSPDHKTMAWTCDTSGAEYYRLFFRSMDSGDDAADVIEDVESVAWADGNTVYYTRVDENHRPSKVFRHTLGTDPSDDVLIYHEKDERFFCAVYTSSSEQYIFIATGMNDQDEVWYISLNETDAKPTLIEPRTEGLEYSVDHQINDSVDRFVVLSNTDNAKDFKISVTDVAKPAREHWTDYQPYKPGRMIHAVEVYRDWVMWLSVEDALPSIYFAGNDGKVSSVVFEEEAYSVGLDVSDEYDVSIFRFNYSSPTTPWQTWEYNCATGDRALLKTQVIPSGHEPSDYVTRRITAISHDGAEVPVTLLHHSKTSLDGSAPCLLYGYGSYGSSVPARFSSNHLSLADRGFVFAIAHVRGGQEKGRDWYEQAKLEKKANSFHDLIASARQLIATAYTAEQNIVIHGGSAGGLLVGASVNMQPDLFAGVIADVPFVDVLNTIIDDTLPLTPGEWSQWGNPIESRAAFDSISAYSPYDNVEAKDYPAMLVTAGVSDPRVTYWEPAKWVAKLRSVKTDNNVLVMKTNMASGHFGKTGRFAMLDDYALSFAFAIAVTNSPVGG